MRPRVLIFSTAYFPFIGGAEVAVRELTDRLPQFEFEMFTVNLDGKREAQEQIGNVLVRRLDINKYLFPWRAASLAAGRHQEQPYQLVWAIMANHAGMAATFFKNKFPQVPFLLTLQEGDDVNSVSYRLRLLGPRFYRVFQSADHIQAISNYLARWGRDMGARCQIDVIPNGVNLGRTEIPKSRSSTIITTSRLVPKNGVDTLVDSLKYLPDDVRLVVVGAGPQATELKETAKNFRLESRIDFVGQVSPAKVYGYLSRADVFVRASRSEGLGNSFLEAMAAGLPVIGTPVGGIPDFLTEGVTGWFCKVGDPQSIAEKVKYILNPANQEIVDRVVVQAKNLILQKYNWDSLAQKMAQILDKMTNSATISG